VDLSNTKQPLSVSPAKNAAKRPSTLAAIDDLPPPDDEADLPPPDDDEPLPPPDEEPPPLEIKPKGKGAKKQKTKSKGKANAQAPQESDASNTGVSMSARIRSKFEKFQFQELKDADLPDAPAMPIPEGFSDEAMSAINNKIKIKEEISVLVTNEVPVDTDEEKWKESFDDSDEETGTFEFAEHRVGAGAALGFGRVLNEKEMLQYQESVIKKSLLHKNLLLSAEACQVFKNIMSFMNDRKSSKTDPVAHARKLLLFQLRASQGLRDEVFLMLCKQTTGRKPAEVGNVDKGWQLMQLCLLMFPPSLELKSFLLSFFKKGTTHLHAPIARRAQACRENMYRIFGLGPRTFVPSAMEIKAVIAGEPLLIEVRFMDGFRRSYPVGHYTTVRVLLKAICKDRGILWANGFALYEAADQRPDEDESDPQAHQIFERVLDGKLRLGDILGDWELEQDEEDLEELKAEDEATRHKRTKHKGIKGKYKEKEHDDFENMDLVTARVKFNHFIFKCRLAIRPDHHKLKGDVKGLEYLFRQVRYNVLNMAYPVLAEEQANLPRLLATLLHEEIGVCSVNATFRSVESLLQSVDRQP
jgi:hypothetical protein